MRALSEIIQANKDFEERDKAGDFDEETYEMCEACGRTREECACNGTTQEELSE